MEARPRQTGAGRYPARLEDAGAHSVDICDRGLIRRRRPAADNELLVATVIAVEVEEGHCDILEGHLLLR